MTDSKTAKKIEVVPCPWCPEEDTRYVVSIDGVTKRTTDDWCGTEAEAQANAAELRGDDCVGCKEGCPLVPSGISDEFVHMSSVGRIVCRGLAGKVAKKRAELEAISEPLRTNFGADAKAAAAHAAAPVLATLQCNVRAETLAATELVEPAPRPLPKDEDGLQSFHKAATSSPAARPQNFKCLDCGHITNEPVYIRCPKCHSLRAAMTTECEPAARVEQREKTAEPYIAEIRQKIKAGRSSGNHIVALEEIQLICERFYKDARTEGEGQPK